MTSLFAVAALVAGIVQVEGPAQCPTPEAVAARLDGLLGAAGDARDDHAVLSTGDGALRIELRSSSGAFLAERRIDARGDCAALAGAAAVVIATWEARLRSE